MAIPAFEVGKINLSFNLARVDPTIDPHDSIQRYLTMNVYRVQGVNNDEPISITGLVAALCLSRAMEMEAAIIETMAKMEDTTDDLDAMTRLQERLLEYEENEIKNLSEDEADLLWKYGIASNTDKNTLISALDTKMDSLNSFSQQVMIDLQSNTKKRDQAFDMITNILKSIYSVTSGIVNNI